MTRVRFVDESHLGSRTSIRDEYGGQLIGYAVFTPVRLPYGRIGLTGDSSRLERTGINNEDNIWN